MVYQKQINHFYIKYCTRLTKTNNNMVTRIQSAIIILLNSLLEKRVNPGAYEITKYQILKVKIVLFLKSDAVMVEYPIIWQNDLLNHR